MPLPKKSHSLQQEDFDRLLAWLDEDREHAGVAYEKVRWRLTTIFASRGCRVPEELADETIDRVSRRVADIQETYIGNRLLYFLGVANNVHHEYLKRPRLPEPSPPSASEDQEQTYNCLEQCLGKLTERSQHLIRQYYAEDKQTKIRLRKALADQLGISLNALRARALRVREVLQSCIERCLESETPSEKVSDEQ
jgi:DNA-directed RNA polymerase specialized sigma24 family protein